MALSIEKTDDVAARSMSATRVFDAPRELVFDLWTNAEHISNWWGPRGFSTTTESMDVRPGGRWIYTMHGPDGVDYANEITYREVVRPERLSYLHGPLDFDVTVTFEERGGKTAVTVTSVFESVDVRNQVADKYGAIEGLHQTLDRFGEEVANVGAFSISHVAEAPRELVFRVWTERDHLQQWFGPRGMEMFHCTNDLRVGGVMHYGLRPRGGKGGGEIWGRWTYREIVPPRKLVFVMSFSDEAAGATRSPFDETWPMEMLCTVTFDEVAPGRTRVNVQSAALNATAQERRTFDAGHKSMNGGWTGTFENLDDYLKKV